MTLDVSPAGQESWLEVDRAAKTCWVAAGARWKQVIAALDPLGLSPAVMLIRVERAWSLGQEKDTKTHGQRAVDMSRDLIEILRDT